MFICILHRLNWGDDLPRPSASRVWNSSQWPEDFLRAPPWSKLLSDRCSTNPYHSCLAFCWWWRTNKRWIESDVQLIVKTNSLWFSTAQLPFFVLFSYVHRHSSYSFKARLVMLYRRITLEPLIKDLKSQTLKRYNHASCTFTFKFCAHSHLLPLCNVISRGMTLGDGILHWGVFVLVLFIRFLGY